MKRIGPKILTFTLILAMILPSFALLPSRVLAQSGGTTGGGAASTYGGGSGLYGGSGGITIGGQSISIGEIGSAITGCAGVGIKQLFQKFNIGGLGQKKAIKGAQEAVKKAQDAVDRAKDAHTTTATVYATAKTVFFAAESLSETAEGLKKGVKLAKKLEKSAKDVITIAQDAEVDALVGWTGAEVLLDTTEEMAQKTEDAEKLTTALEYMEAAKFFAGQAEDEAEKAEDAAERAEAIGDILQKIEDDLSVADLTSLIQEFIDNSVPVYSMPEEAATRDMIIQLTEELEKVQLKLEKLLIETGKVKKETKEIKKITDKQRIKEVCLDGIMYSIARVLLRNFTAATIEWINTGFLEKTIDAEGNVEEKKKPLYLENTKEFFENIWEQETRGLANIYLNNPYDYPFGEAVAKALMTGISRRFEDQARFTLREFVYGGDYEAYYFDFRLGGWPAWLALTQIPANNPIGFRFLSAQEYANRTRGPRRLSLAEELNLDLRFSGGFLSIKKCVRATAEGQSKIGPNKPFSDVGDLPAKNREYCASYRVQTPGQAAASLLNISITSGYRQAELADELNESLAAIFDAFLAKLINKGLSAIDEEWFDETDQAIADPSRGIYSIDTIGGAFPDATDEDIEESEIIPFPIQIEEAKITVTDAVTTPSELRVKLDAPDEMVGKFIFGSGFYAEATILELKIGFSSSNQNLTSLAGGRILVGGTQVNNTIQPISSAGTTFSLTGFTLAPRSTVQVEIRANVFSDDGQGGNLLFDEDTITISVLPHTSNAVVETILVDAPEDETAGQEITVMGPPAMLVEDTSYSDQDVSINDFPIDNGGDGFEIGRWTLTGNTSRDISIQTLSFDIDEVVGDTFKEENISSMYVMYGTEQILSWGVTEEDNTFFVITPLPPGDPNPEEITISLFATLDNDPDNIDPNTGQVIPPTINDSFKTNLTVEIFDFAFFETVEIEDIDGQTITAQ